MSYDTQESAAALAPLGKMAAEIASVSGVSYQEALGALLGASELLARAWEKGLGSGITYTQRRGRQRVGEALPPEPVNPYRNDRQR